MNNRLGLQIFTVLVCSLQLLCYAKEGVLEMVKEGSCDYKLYVDNEAIESEKFAAEELRKYFKESTGIQLQKTNNISKDDKVIIVGLSKKLSQLCEDIDFDNLKNDEIVLKTVGNCIVLAGERPRGSIYAVYEFLETELGIRFYLPEYTKIPKVTNLSINRLNYRYASPIMIREAFGLETNNKPFAVKMRNNGHYNLKLTPKLGGHHVYKPDLCHTFGHVLPFRKYHKTNPDFFTLIDGKRFEAQLCFSNKSMRREFIKNALEYVGKEREKGFHIFQFSQLDGASEQHNCQCPNCIKMRKELGSCTDVMIDFMNEVTESITQKYDDIYIETLAYTYTAPAPKKVKPHKNLIVRLCLGYDNAFYPLYHQENKHLYDNFMAWRKLGTTLSLWIYKANYIAMLTPYPTLGSYKNELKTLLESGPLFSVFLQCVHVGPNDFSGLKTYLGSKLLWNPNANADTIIDDFLKDVFQEAYTDVKKYLSLLRNDIEAGDKKVTVSANTSGFLSLKTLQEGLEIIRSAKKKVSKDHPIAIKELGFIELGIIQAIAMRPELTFINGNESLNDYRKSIYKEAESQSLSLGCYMYAERITRAQALAKMRHNLFPPKKTGIKADIGLDLSNVNYVEYTVPDIQTWYAAKEVDDPLAATGRAAYFHYKIQFWPVFLHFPIIKDTTTYSVYISARCQPDKQTDPKSPAFSAGVYDYTRKKYLIKSQYIPVEKLQTDKYRFFKLGTVKQIPNNDIQVFVASEISGGTKQIWIDRILLIQE